MRGPYKYELQDKYPHLSLAEADIWNRFVAKFPDAFVECYYDVELGSIRGNTEELNPEWRANADYLGKYKIDVLGWSPHGWTIIEVKKAATTKALGEIWLYDDLFNKEFESKKPVFNMIVTDEEMPDIRACCEAEAVALHVV